MTDQELAPKETVIALMKGTVPGRADAINSLWTRYNPDVVLAHDGKQIAQDGNKSRILFDAKVLVPIPFCLFVIFRACFR